MTDLISKTWTLKDKKALITGATKGIGKAIAEMLLNFDAEVFIVARNSSDIKSFIKRLRKTNNKVHGISCDLSTDTGQEFLFKNVQKSMHGLDILVNNVGMNIRKKTVDYTIEEINRIINTNLMSGFTLSKLFYNYLKESGEGNIINISSVAGITHLKTGSIYGMTKAAIIQLTKNLAVEWAPDNIRVNAIAPWYIKTPLANTVLSNKDYLDEVLKRTPLKKIGDPEDVASVAAFLCMPAAKYVTGQCVNVDGGFSINGF